MIPLDLHLKVPASNSAYRRFEDWAYRDSIQYNLKKVYGLVVIGKGGHLGPTFRHPTSLEGLMYMDCSRG